MNPETYHQLRAEVLQQHQAQLAALDTLAALFQVPVTTAPPETNGERVRKFLAPTPPPPPLPARDAKRPAPVPAANWAGRGRVSGAMLKLRELIAALPEPFTTQQLRAQFDPWAATQPLKVQRDYVAKQMYSMESHGHLVGRAVPGAPGRAKQYTRAKKFTVHPDLKNPVEASYRQARAAMNLPAAKTWTDAHATEKDEDAAA